MTVRIPFAGSSWNKKASELGWADDQYQPLAERFRLYAGGQAPAGNLKLSMHDYSVPIYDANVQKPNTTAKIFQSSWAMNGSGIFDGVKVGDTIPWNYAWQPGTGNDRIFIVENFLLKGVLVTLELWGVYANWTEGLNWPNLFAGYFNPYGNKIVTAGIVATKGIYEPGWKTIINRGMGINKRALVTTADEVASGDIGHALEVTIANTAWTDKYPGVKDKDFFAPATRCEWLTKDAPTRNGIPEAFDPNPDHNLPEGLRIAVDMTDEQIDLWSKGQPAIKTFICALRDYGMIIAETGGYGCNIEVTGDIGPDRDKWKSLGITKDTDVFGGLLNQFPLKIVKAA